jgi:hypothetical protein
MEAFMLNCADMKEGDTYTCKECGLEIKIVKECKECSEAACSCESGCKFVCCGEELTKK